MWINFSTTTHAFSIQFQSINDIWIMEKHFLLVIRTKSKILFLHDHGSYSNSRILFNFWIKTCKRCWAKSLMSRIIGGCKMLDGFLPDLVTLTFVLGLVGAVLWHSQCCRCVISACLRMLILLSVVLLLHCCCIIVIHKGVDTSLSITHLCLH